MWRFGKIEAEWADWYSPIMFSGFHVENEPVDDQTHFEQRFPFKRALRELLRFGRMNEHRNVMAIV
jgi:hypothetical protein